MTCPLLVDPVVCESTGSTPTCGSSLDGSTDRQLGWWKVEYYNGPSKLVPDQNLRLLGRPDQFLANGQDLASVCRTLGFSKSSVNRLRERNGDMNADDAKRLKERSLIR